MARSNGQSRLLIAAALAVLLPGRAAAAEGLLRVLADELPCPDVEQLAADIASAVRPAIPDQTLCVLKLERPAPGYAALRLQCGAESFQRSIPFRPDECRELARTAAILAEGWLAHLQVVEVPSRTEAEPGRSALASSSATPPAPAPEAGPRWRWALLGGATAYLPQPATAGLAASAEWIATARLGAGLAAGIASPNTGRSPSRGQVAITPAWVGALAAYRLAAGSHARLDLLGGPSVHLLFSSSSSSRAVHRRLLADLSITTLLRAQYRIRGPIWASAAIEGALRTHREHLWVGSERLLTLEPAEVSLLFGVAYETD